jgi:hypothetical protein
MATTNKALTTYLPTESVEWLEKYCLDYKHLLNKEGNPKLGTALADIISRLADGELTLPPKIEPTSTVIDNATYSTEISGLKGEIEELRKVFKEYSTNNVPSTVPDDSLRGEVEALGGLVIELETYTKSQFEAVREELKQATNNRTANTDSIATTQAKPSSEEKRLREDPKLAARVADGLTQGKTGQALGLADGGFSNKKGEIYDGGTLSRFKAASELLTEQAK